MVEQVDIIKTDLDPTKGHEQAGYRPAIVISPALFTKEIFEKISNLIKASVDLENDYCE